MAATFESCFLNMYQAGKTPDSGMEAEREGVIDRYRGEGEEPFYYSLRLHSPCDKKAFDFLVKKEIALAKKRNRYFFEWKEYDLPALPFVPEGLRRHGFEVARESRLLYAPVDQRGEPTLDLRLRLAVHGARRLVEHQHGRVGGDRSGE